MVYVYKFLETLTHIKSYLFLKLIKEFMDWFLWTNSHNFWVNWDVAEFFTCSKYFRLVFVCKFALWELLR